MQLAPLGNRLDVAARGVNMLLMKYVGHSIQIFSAQNVVPGCHLSLAIISAGSSTKFPTRSAILAIVAPSTTR